MLLTKLKSYEQPTVEEKDSNHLILEILNAIYPESYKRTFVGESDHLCCWLNDRNQMSTIENRIEMLATQKESIHIISSTELNFIKNFSNVELFTIKNGSETILVLGYLNYYLQQYKCPVNIKVIDEKYLDVYKQIIKIYTLSYVSNFTGLSTERLQYLYQSFISYEWYHFLLFGNEKTKRNIQGIRSICLLPLFEQHSEKIKTYIPITFEKNPTKQHEFIPQNKKDQYGRKRSIMDVQRIDPSNLMKKEEDQRILLYDLDFAEKFDVDPFPLYVG